MTQLVRDGVPMELRPLVWQETPYSTSIHDLVAPGWREPVPFLVSGLGTAAFPNMSRDWAPALPVATRITASKGTNNRSKGMDSRS